MALLSGERVGAVIVGAGSGQRLGGVEKAFMPIAGQPLLAYSGDVFQASDLVDDVCLVVSPWSVERARDLAATRGWRKVSAVVPGGNERQESVRAGVEALSGCEWLLIHDAARPLVDLQMIERGLAAARDSGAAIAATPVRDTLKRVGAGTGDMYPIVETVDRRRLWGAQTPQVFRAEVLRAAFERAGERAGTYTDDAAMVADAGYQVVVFEGGAANLKVTLPDDVPLLEALLLTRRDRAR